MKFFIVCFIVGSLIAEGLSAPVENAEETNVQHVNERQATTEIENTDGVRFRKAANGGAPVPRSASYGPATAYTYQSAAPTVPCGKNLLFSCQPSVAPVPCYAPPPTYPSYAAPAPAPYAGAYSEPVAQWAYHPTINHLW